VMQRGRVVEAAPVGELFSRPQHEYTRTLLAATLDDTAAREPYRAPAGAEGAGS
jgi:ABC-type dipeptide/oligopeptide/nickel transport system ATPase component